MKIIDLTCTKCGSSLQINYEQGMTTAYYQYCGQKILLDDNAINIRIHHDMTVKHKNITENRNETIDTIGAIGIVVLLIIIWVVYMMIL